jgi:hypothetical protein
MPVIAFLIANYHSTACNPDTVLTGFQLAKKVKLSQQY